jgi:GYF domain 2
MSLVSASVSDALNGVWRINVSGQVYGPYTGHQIKAFATEGRIAPHSIVQTGEQGPWITAIDDPILGQLFVKKQLPAATSMGEPQTTRAAEGAAAAAEVATANFVIVADIRSRASTPFEAAMSKMGDNYRLNPIVWLLHTDRTAGAIRNELVQHLGQTDTLFIVDATRGKTAWFNLGPEPDSKIRRVWKRTTDKGNS